MLVYDVVNGQGKLVDRVQIPEDRRIVGFDRAGHIIFAIRDEGGEILERARIR
jgi:hypothetical protein